MTDATRNNYQYHKPLTAEAIHTLEEKGYRYLQVQGFTIDHHAEYVEPHYLMLVPFKELPMDVYEPINSPLVHEWISNSARGGSMEIFLAGNKKNSYR
jgi:hypothetical protein